MPVPRLIVCCFLAATAAFAQDSTPADLAAPAMRQRLAEERRAIAASPNNPDLYVKLAYTLTDAGMGAQARKEIARATSIGPNSAYAWSAQGWVLSHNLIGVEYGRGFDYDGSIAAYNKSIELDPTDMDTRFGLSVVLDHNRAGIVYAPDAKLSEAIRVLRYVRDHQRNVPAEVTDNLAFDLFYSGDYNAVTGELTAVTSSPTRRAIALAALAASKGSALAIERASQISGDDQKRKDALILAAEGLWNMRLYPQAADLLTAALPDSSHENLSQKIALFRSLKPYAGPALPPTDPRSPMERLMVGAMSGRDMTALQSDVVAHHYPAGAASTGNGVDGTAYFATMLASIQRKTGLPAVVMRDLILAQMKLSADHATETSARVSMSFLSAARESIFVLKEDGVWKIAGSRNDTNRDGQEALYLATHDRLKDATALLDWLQSVAVPQNAEAFVTAGSARAAVFAQAWAAQQQQPTVDQVRLAVAALITDAATLETLLPGVQKYCEAAVNGDRRLGEKDTCNLVLASMQLNLGRAAAAEKPGYAYLDRPPYAPLGLELVGQALGAQGKWSEWKALLAAALKQDSKDHGLLHLAAEEAEAEGDFTRARAIYHDLLEDGAQIPADRNLYAWLSLFTGKVDDDALEVAQAASMDTKERNYAILHTLACLRAVHGDTAQARQLLQDAMEAGNLDEPNPAIWLGFGLIYEQYGEREAARAAYARVTKPAGSLDPVDAWVLAQMRLKAMGPA